MTTDSKKCFDNATQGNPTYETFERKIKKIPLREILVIYKYIVYSDKKIHHIMYKETCNEISENLLDDFIDSDDETRIVLPKALSEHKKAKVATSSAAEPLDPKIKIVDISKAV